jgi:hypothetical protein
MKAMDLNIYLKQKIGFPIKNEGPTSKQYSKKITIEGKPVLNVSAAKAFKGDQPCTTLKICY